VRLLKEDEFSKQREELEDLVSDASSFGENEEFRAFRAGLRTRSKASERKWLILESWLLRWRLSKVATEPETIQVGYFCPMSAERVGLRFRFSFRLELGTCSKVSKRSG
jgi:hypothetical protein